VCVCVWKCVRGERVAHTEREEESQSKTESKSLLRHNLDGYGNGTPETFPLPGHQIDFSKAFRPNSTNEFCSLGR